jgi:hypothetical protein
MSQTYLRKTIVNVMKKLKFSLSKTNLLIDLKTKCHYKNDVFSVERFFSPLLVNYWIILTEREVSIQLTSSLSYLVL